MSDALRLHFNERPDCITAIDKAMPFGESLWRYPDRKPLEQTLADINNVTPEQILCTNGGDEAIMILMRILSEGIPLILPLPAFSQYTWGIESWQLAPTVIQPTDDLSIDLDGVRQALESVQASEQADQPAAVLVLTSPNNPTGEQLSNATLVELLIKANKANVWVFLDEAYIEFSSRGSDSAKWLTQYPNLIVLKTLSKAYGLAGIRLGYILGDKTVISEFEKRCAPFNIATPSLEIAKAALQPEARKEVANYCTSIQNNREKLFNWLLQRMVPVIDGEANFLMLPFSNDQAGKNRATVCARFLARNNILIRQFNDSLNHCIRITIPYDMTALMSCLKQLFEPELICLDMDGVLIDTSDSYDRTIMATIKRVTGADIAFEKIQNKRNSGGFNNDWVLSQALLADMGTEITLEAVTDIFQGLYLGTEQTTGFVANEQALIQKRLVETIKQENKPNWGIVTGRPLTEAKAGQKLVGLKSLALISLDCAAAKPAPDGIQRLQSQFGTKSWMCGDNPDDIQAAIASGSVAIGIRKQDKQALYDVGADIVLDSINELEEWL